jgi:hypothetical protein
MADQPQPPTSGNPPQASGLVIPAETEAKFGPLLALIKGSESMNDEERQYWINILPIMTPDQLKNLEDILQNEKQQLAAIDAKYSKEMSAISSAGSVAGTEQKIKAKKREREQREAANAQAERSTEDAILSQIQSL